MTHPTFLPSLESNQTLFDDMFNNLLSGLIVADSNYECVYINATAEQILSVSQHHLLHKNVIDILTPANYEKLLTQASEQWLKCNLNANNLLENIWIIVTTDK